MNKGVGDDGIPPESIPPDSSLNTLDLMSVLTAEQQVVNAGIAASTSVEAAYVHHGFRPGICASRHVARKLCIFGV